MSETSLSISYKSCEDYLLSLPRHMPGQRSLPALRRFISYLGDPHKLPQRKKIIHVGGTNGKGSTCTYLAAILSVCGKKTAVFSSPHLICMRERIRIGEQMVSEAEFVCVFAMVREKLAAFRQEQAGDFRLPFFDFLFVMALIIFSRADVEYIILECGIGGRMDATNALANKDLAILSRIGLDHMEYLGDTLGAIAAEKAAIIRAGVPALSAKQAPEALDVIAEYAATQSAPLHVVDNDRLKIHEIGNKSIDFSYQYRYDKIAGLKLKTPALYQTENAALAVHAALLLLDSDISEATLNAGLMLAKWPGRMDEMAPGIIFDGAHNEDGIGAFLAAVGQLVCSGKKYLLFGGTGEKDSARIASLLSASGLFTEIAACHFDSPRSLTPAQLSAYFNTAQIFENAQGGLGYLLSKKQAEDMIFICGSLYLYADIVAAVTPK